LRSYKLATKVEKRGIENQEKKWGLISGSKKKNLMINKRQCEKYNNERDTSKEGILLMRWGE